MPEQPLLFGQPIPRAPLSVRETAAYRVMHISTAANLKELLTVLLGSEPVADTVLGKYGTAMAIARAGALELAQLKGVTEHKARLLRAAVELGRRVATEGAADRKLIHSPREAYDLLAPLLEDKEQEYLYVLLLDTRNRVLGVPVEVYHGSLNTSLIRVGEIFKEAIRANAAALILAHNHPSSDPSPSPEDVAVTRAVREAGKLLDIDVLDHLVIGHQRFVSLKERGLGF